MVEKHTSKNGLRIVKETIPAVRSVTIGIWILTGSRYEHKQNNGISHFIEHMLFKGTQKRSAKDIAEAFDAIGGEVNAFTSKEYTCFYAKVLDTHKELALDILADMFFNSSFNEAEMEREKKVVLEEIKMYEDTPDDIVHDLLARASYGTHPLGFPILGTEEHLQRFTPDMLQSYVDTHYIPENVVVSVAGNIDDAFVRLIDEYFGTYKANATAQTLKKPVFLSESIKRHKDTEQAHLCLGYNGLAIDDDQVYSLVMINNVLGGSMSSRLFQEIREQRGLAYAVFSYHASFLDSGMLTIYAGTGKDQLPELQNIMQKTLDILMEDGLTDKELTNSKEQLKGNLVLSSESTNSKMSRNGRNEVLLQRHRTLDEMIQDIDRVTHESVRLVLDQVFQSSPAMAIIAPEVTPS